MESTRFTIDPGQRSTPFRSTRSWTAAAILISAGLLSAGRDAAAQDPGVRKEARPEKSAEVEVRVFDRAGKLVGPVTMKKVVKTDAEWRAQLTKEQYEIARRQGTERAYCGTLLDNQKEGAYSCVCCRLPLFGSGSKFKSGTGWPSFFRPIARENVAEKRDVSHGMVRTEILCARCDAHLGHVFRDGPRPTGLRYCLNSESLTFTEKKALGSLADPAAAKHRAARAVFAGGCFWCVEAVFEQLDGVIEVVSGYTGGKKKTASYRAVVSGTTGHAEAVRILYDPKKISYAKLLEVHFATHDPTTVNRQGADVGAQYRSSIFFANANEKRTAAAYIEQLTEAKVFERPIVTRLEPFQAFYPAEPHHQDYVCQNPDQPYVRRVALPKLEKVRKRFADRLKREAPPRR